MLARLLVLRSKTAHNTYFKSLATKRFSIESNKPRGWKFWLSSCSLMKFECVIKPDCTNRKRAPTHSTRHYEHYVINHETILDVVKNSCERFRCLQHTWFSPGIVEFVKHLSTMETSCLKFDTNVSVHNFTRSVGSTTSSSFCRPSL